MGWRDINLNRRKPQMRFAVVPRAEGQDHASAVLRKAAELALSAAAAQAEAFGPGGPQQKLHAVVAGYLAGYARHQGLRHGVDAEEVMPALIEALAAEAGGSLAATLRNLSFSPRAGNAGTSRAALRADPPLADAGYLVGHLDSVCGTRRLLAALQESRAAPDGLAAFLTACDLAADRMQTHQPTMSLRFDTGERAIIAAALSGLLAGG